MGNRTNTNPNSGQFFIYTIDRSAYTAPPLEASMSSKSKPPKPFLDVLTRFSDWNGKLGNVVRLAFPFQGCDLGYVIFEPQETGRVFVVSTTPLFHLEPISLGGWAVVDSQMNVQRFTGYQGARYTEPSPAKPSLVEQLLSSIGSPSELEDDPTPEQQKDGLLHQLSFTTNPFLLQRLVDAGADGEVFQRLLAMYDTLVLIGAVKKEIVSSQPGTLGMNQFLCAGFGLLPNVVGSVIMANSFIVNLCSNIQKGGGQAPS